VAQEYSLFIDALRKERPTRLYVQDATRAEMLWDDLADIYHDLQMGLHHWQSGTPQGRETAAWEWRLHYEFHWGDHLFRAMTTVHEVRYQLQRE